MTRPVVGFIGTGIMGEPMAHHLLKAGYPIRVWNRSAEKLNSLIAAGAVPCANAATASHGSAILICMLSDGPTCDAVLFGPRGAVPAMAAGNTVVVMSSIPVTTAIAQARQAAVYGIHYLDAPVSGGQVAARNASLAIMAGGTEDDFQSVQPVLAVLGRPVRVGPAGCGELAKLVNQMIVASTIAAVSEAFLLAERGGADLSKVREALAGGFADSPILQQHGQRMITNQFAPGGAAKWQLKDTRTALAFSESVGLSLPMLQLVNSLFEEMVEHGDGELDHSGLIRELRRRNGMVAPSDREGAEPPESAPLNSQPHLRYERG